VIFSQGGGGGTNTLPTPYGHVWLLLLLFLFLVDRYLWYLQHQLVFEVPIGI
jgi:hypothetical protein